jgi:Na+/melibiose symporter-like transporter
MAVRRGLRHDRDFLKLWAGQGVSSFGSLVSRLALPFTAVLTLHAGAAQMALLVGVETAAGLASAAVAGPIADRVPRRSLMIGADLIRAGVLSCVPIAAAAGSLTMALLIVVAVLAGAFGALFDVAYEAYLPGLVSLERLAEANSLLGATAAATEAVAFASAGLLVQLFGGPGAVAIDAATFLISAASLLALRAREQRTARQADDDERGALLGLKLVCRDRLLRPLLLNAVCLNLMYGLVGTVWLIFVGRVLSVPAALIGLLTACGGLASMAGAAFAPRVARRIGAGALLIAAGFAQAAALALLPLAGGPPVLVGILLTGQQVSGDAGAGAQEVTALTARQSATPPALLGRAGAAFRFVSLTALLAGTVAGGLLGSVAGPRAVLLAGAIAPALGALALLAGGVAQRDHAAPALEELP